MKENNIEKLKPCPFCGEIPVVTKYTDNISGKTFYAIDCDNKKCNVLPFTSDFLEKEKAIECWNTRKGE